MLRILVAGGFDTNDAKKGDIEQFCICLGEAIAAQGHTLLNGCRTELDQMIAGSTYRKMKELNDPDPDKRVISYLLHGQEPVHEFGSVIGSRLTDWEIDKASFYIPEQIQMAEVVILVGGFEGTYRAANWARISNKPLLPFATFGGAAAEIYEKEFGDFDRKYAGRIDKLDYQELNSIKKDWSIRATKLVSLAEKIATSKTVTVIMSYSQEEELVDTYASFQDVCKESQFGYQCQRVEDANTIGRITPKIVEQIEQSAFIIADLTGLRPNVFFELGYAQGLKKPVVVTAKSGTDLPFDVKDMPTIFWKGQTQLKTELRTKIKLIAEKQGR